jgi:hypothetical protein
MNTDVSGHVFISYRRTRTTDVELLVPALHDVGIPTWVDTMDMRYQPTEESLRTCLRDSSTAGAILYLTPDVRDSPYVRLETEEILRRHARSDGFWVLPLVGGGLDYAEASTVLAGVIGADTLAEWNLLKTNDPFTPTIAVEVAAAALRERIVAISDRLPPGDPVRVQLRVRDATPTAPGSDLIMDWRSHFTPDADPAVWETTLLPAVRTVRQTLQKHAPGRPIDLEGRPSLPAAFAFGHALPEPSGQPVRYVQFMRGDGSTQAWSLNAASDATLADERGWTAKTIAKNINGLHLAVLISITNDTHRWYATSLTDLPPMRAQIIIDHSDAANTSSNDRPDIQIRDDREAASLARMTSRAIRNALDTYGPLEAVHLFFAGPAGLAVLIGQLTNTLPPVVTYDAIHDTGRYTRAATLLPAANR